jgi:hypothetical protein
MSDQGAPLNMTPDASAAVPTNPLQFKIEKILVPLDFSPASLEALEYAVWLAKQFRAAIHLVHVYPPNRPFDARTQRTEASFAREHGGTSRPQRTVPCCCRAKAKTEIESDGGQNARD